MSLLDAIQNAATVHDVNTLMNQGDIQVSISWSGKRLISRGEDCVPLQALIEKVHHMGIDIVVRDRYIVISDEELAAGHDLAERVHLWKQEADRQYGSRHPIFKVIEFVLHFLETVISGSARANDAFANRSIQSFRLLFSGTAPFQQEQTLLSSLATTPSDHSGEHNHIHHHLRQIAQRIVAGEFEEEGVASTRNQFYKVVYKVAKRHHYQDDVREKDPSWAEKNWDSHQEILRQSLLSLAQSADINSEYLQEALMQFAVFTD